MSGLTITRPENMTRQKLVSSNVPEDDYPEWSANTTYAKGARCITASTFQVWQSSDAGNVGNNPLTSPDKWVSPGAMNVWRVFDDVINTQTAYPIQISYQIRPGSAITSVNILNVTNCTSIRVRMVDPSFGLVYDNTVDMVALPDAVSWWDWTFGIRRDPTLADFDDLPSYPNAVLHVDLYGGPQLAVGVIGFGQSVSFGWGVQRGAGVGMISHSVRERDEFGNLILKRRLPSKRMNFTLIVDNGELDALNMYLMDIDGIACFFSASINYESLKVYGPLANFDSRISYAHESLFDIEVEGFI